MEESNFGFVKDGWLTLTVDVTLKDQRQTVHRRPELDDEFTHAADQQLCVVCMDQMQTSGVLHGQTYVNVHRVLLFQGFNS